MAAAAPLLLAAPALKKGADVVVDLAKSQVIGWQRSQSYTKGKGRNERQVTEVATMTVKAWEIAALALGGILVLQIAAAQKAVGNLAGHTIWDFFKDPVGQITWMFGGG